MEVLGYFHESRMTYTEVVFICWIVWETHRRAETPLECVRLSIKDIPYADDASFASRSLEGLARMILPSRYLRHLA